MVPGTERGHVRQIGRAEELPPVHVMDLAVVERGLALGERTGLVQLAQRPALLPVRQSFLTPDVERAAVAAEDHREDLGLATQPADVGHRDRDAVGQVADAAGVGAVEE